MITGDTIAAISSASGASARMIVRLSGPAAYHIAAQLSPELAGAAGSAARLSLAFCGLTVPSWVYVFRGPRSYTGEDVIELHLPGNPVLGRMLLRDLLGRGARAAEPGEFTARAYFNGRLDLTAAEGVAATIAAGSDAELQAARQLMSGELARRLRPALDSIAGALALVEVGIDFSDEDVSPLSPEAASAEIGRVASALRALLAESGRFERLSHEPHLVLVGRPNAGKSTLLNALAGHPRALTSPTAGTTRDVLTAEVALSRGIVRLSDLAGLEDAMLPGQDKPAQATEAAMNPNASGALGEVARLMRERALAAVETADRVILIRDASDPRPPLRLERAVDYTVFSKADLPMDDRAGQADASVQMPTLFVSAVTGENLAVLRSALDGLAFGNTAAGATLALNVRHVLAIEHALAALARAAELTHSGAAELLALELRDALDALGQVLGQITPDDLLGRIFSAFCIGK